MSNGNGSGIALGGLVFATVLGVLAVAAGTWFGGAWYYGQERIKVRDRVLATADWSPQRVSRNWSGDCDAGRLREEAESLFGDVGAFDVGKVDRFKEAPSDQRARELTRTLKELQPSVDAFLSAADCSENSRLVRTGSEQQPSGPVITRAILVGSWVDADRVPDLRKALWVGRDIQAAGGLYEFKEGAAVMESAYIALGHALAEGYLDGQLEEVQAELQLLADNEDSAQLHWRAGARLLLADLLGADWEANPPTPLRAKAMLESMDGVIASLESMPDVASKPYPERHKVMKEWVAEHDMSTWDSKFRGFGKAGVQVDGLATETHARGRALLIAVALQRYKRQRGSCPRELEELVTGGLLAAIPTDPLGDAPFTYDRDSCRVTSAAPLLKGEPVSVSATQFP
ncbi:MAG: hypothetical protein H6737_01765 [Alphaproteobacteria bacterium]|nr:hypothetical protein [Alphaproteobacteria bacterium]